MAEAINIYEDSVQQMERELFILGGRRKTACFYAVVLCAVDGLTIYLFPWSNLKSKFESEHPNLMWLIFFSVLAFLSLINERELFILGGRRKTACFYAVVLCAVDGLTIYLFPWSNLKSKFESEHPNLMWLIFFSVLAFLSLINASYVTWYEHKRELWWKKNLKKLDRKKFVIVENQSAQNLTENVSYVPLQENVTIQFHQELPILQPLNKELEVHRIRSSSESASSSQHVDYSDQYARHTDASSVHSPGYSGTPRFSYELTTGQTLSNPAGVISTIHTRSPKCDNIYGASTSSSDVSAPINQMMASTPPRIMTRSSSSPNIYHEAPKCRELSISVRETTRGTPPRNEHQKEEMDRQRRRSQRLAQQQERLKQVKEEIEPPSSGELRRRRLNDLLDTPTGYKKRSFSK